MRSRIKKCFGVLITCLVLCALFPAAETLAKDLVVMIDPGHGCSETGAFREWNGVKYREEVLNLKIARYLRAELETYRDVKVYMTHNSLTGHGMDRLQRIKAAKGKNADVLISIHNNSTAEEKTSRTGSCVIVPSVKNYPDRLAYAKTSRKLGTAVLKELNARVRLYNNGYWIDDELGIILYGMKYKIPSIIVEHCFVNNPKDCEKYLKSEVQLRKIGQADAAAIAKCYNLKKNNGTPAKNGWVTGENGKKYYYVNDVMTAGTWKKIGGHYYYFNEDGVLQTGAFQVGNYFYLSDKNGVRLKGFVTCNGRKYYADSKGKLYTGWKKIGGKTYYFAKREKGAALTGFKSIGKDYYFFSKSSSAMMTRWVTVSSGQKRYFSQKDGKMQKNRWVKWSGKWYYVGSSGAPYKNTRKKIDGITYKFDKKGICTNK